MTKSPAKETKKILKGGARDPAYLAVVNAFATGRAVTLGTAREGALKRNGKVFALRSAKGEFVVKLPRKRMVELIDSAQATSWDVGAGIPMKAYAVIGVGQDWVQFAKEARRYVARAR